MARQRRTIKDPAALKALAHPLRMDLLDALVAKGPRTATELAEEIGSSPSNCSWHLRKLAEHGFVSEVAGATGRARPWQAATAGLSWDEADEAPETRAAGLGLTEVLLSRELQRLLRAQQSLHLEPPEWRQASTVVQSATWMTAEEAREVSERLAELLMTYAERAHDPALRPDGSRQVSMVGWLTPRPDPGAAPRTADRAEADKTTAADQAPTDGGESR